MKLEEHGGVISVRKPEACMGLRSPAPTCRVHCPTGFSAKCAMRCIATTCWFYAASRWNRKASSNRQPFRQAEPHVLDQFHHPEYTDILILSNVKKDGKPMGLADGGTYWHSDYSYLEIPARATLLYSIQVPKVGGDTLFADQEQAYEDLPGAMKKRIDVTGDAECLRQPRRSRSGVAYFRVRADTGQRRSAALR